jgi:hypothetical protein
MTVDETEEYIARLEDRLDDYVAHYARVCEAAQAVVDQWHVAQPVGVLMHGLMHALAVALAQVAEEKRDQE